MKKEGTGHPRNPEIAFEATERVRELHFDEVPTLEVRFRGSTMRNSVWESSRENLPDRVRNGVVYRDARVRLRIATEMVDADFVIQNTLDGEGVKGTPEQQSENCKASTGEYGGED